MNKQFLFKIRFTSFFLPLRILFFFALISSLLLRAPHSTSFREEIFSLKSFIFERISMCFRVPFLESQTCIGCQATSRFRRFTCPKCKKGPFCGNCLNYGAISFAAPEPSSAQTAASPSAAATARIKTATTASVCEECFRASVVGVDLTKTFEIVEPSDRFLVDGKPPTIIIVHGGGGCRAMYRPLAQFLAKNGVRSILIDLPGHGGRMREKLNIATCVETIIQTVRSLANDPNEKPFYLGGSFGGYVGMEALGAHPDAFQGAVIACARQCVGRGAGIKASVGLWAMTQIQHVMYPKSMIDLMLKVAGNAPNLDPVLLESCSLLPGMYFHAGIEQTTTLRSTNSIPAMTKFSGPVLYVDGSEDHHDMDATLLALSQENERKRNQSIPALASAPPLTTAVIYDKGDHFFSHDIRFQNKFEAEVLSFIQKVVQRNRTNK